MQENAEPQIVGIGASAGGVKALQEFFEALPNKVGAAFVVIVHLDPQARSEMAAILSARTTMPVEQVGEGAKLLADHVYVIAPNQELRISDHHISARPFDEPRGYRAPIDLFFCSLADQHDDALAIVLTGAGSDGSVGVRAIKEAGGIVLVQDPYEAEYASMPRSAIATEMADFVFPYPNWQSVLSTYSNHGNASFPASRTLRKTNYDGSSLMSGRAQDMISPNINERR